MGQEREEAGQVNPRGESVSRDNLTQAQAQVNPHRTGEKNRTGFRVKNEQR
jgi:hypothetical protein